MNTPKTATSQSPDSKPTDPDGAVRVAFGDRHEEVRFEPDPDQLAVARHLVKPDGPRLEDDTISAGAIPTDAPPVEDVLVAPVSPSVWDARPPADDADKRGKPAGH